MSLGSDARCFPHRALFNLWLNKYKFAAAARSASSGTLQLFQNIAPFPSCRRTMTHWPPCINQWLPCMANIAPRVGA